MPTLTLERLRSDKRRKEHDYWHDWMISAAELANRFHDDADEDDPFGYNETAAVGFLAAAATSAGFLALPEFAIRKMDVEDRRRRKRGRSDLWLQAKLDRCWWFEFKHHHAFRGSERDLERKWEAASTCAEAVKIHGTCVAGLIVSLTWVKEHYDERLQATRAAVERFASHRQFVWRLMGERANPETYIFLEIIRQD